MYKNFSTRMHLLDFEGRIIGLLAGNPDTNQWHEVEMDARNSLDAARENLYPEGQNDHRRGSFATLRAGVSFGGSQMEPMNLSNTGQIAKVVDWLNNQNSFKRIASFGSFK
jgi:hypothetical protein